MADLCWDERQEEPFPLTHQPMLSRLQVKMLAWGIALAQGGEVGAGCCSRTHWSLNPEKEQGRLWPACPPQASGSGWV